MNPNQNVQITQANGGYIISTPAGLFVATNLNAAVRIAKEAFQTTAEPASE